MNGPDSAHLRLYLSILGLWLGMLFSSCEQNEIEEVQAFDTDEEIPDRSSYGVKLQYSDSGRKTVELQAEEMNHFQGDEGRRVEFQKGFKVTFFGKEDSANSVMKAQQGTLYEAEQKMVARNNVVVNNAKGERLNTEKLIWDRDSGKIHTDEFVKITRDDGVIQGNGLEAEEDLNKYRIHEITGEWYFDRPKENENGENAEGQ